jgi:hypothetical protein
MICTNASAVFHTNDADAGKTGTAIVKAVNTAGRITLCNGLAGVQDIAVRIHGDDNIAEYALRAAIRPIDQTNLS